MKSKKHPSCAVVIAAAGASRRFGGEDKLFAPIGGTPALARTLAAFQRCGAIREIVVVARERELTRVAELVAEYSITKASRVIVGGATRLESVYNGVFAVTPSVKLIAVHDGARPLVTEEVIADAVSMAAKHAAAAPAVPVKPTVKRAKNGVVTETLDRDGLFEAQTPQVFEASVLKGALTNARDKRLDVTDDGAAAEAIGVAVWLTKGSYENIKLTTAEDLILAEAILSRRERIL
ncbi:MAG: 2-C-methyl-D-erythritol 4-phosphate cytidylyltransferase [Oscillospiraceae bacterium]|jgi:2-C-methyl-D-erythritol 4-phosphate cytidylyltransferase|nr:2-C-methyl-D-erythritol 4-phosphate cytidylyltransferase [Oscillospiraceae bacterium]